VALLAQLPAAVIGAAGVYVAAVIGSVVFLGMGGASPGGGEVTLLFLRWLIALSPVLFGALLCGAVTWWRTRRRRREIDQSGGWTPARAPVRGGITRLLWLITVAVTAAVCFAPLVGVVPPPFSIEDFWLAPGAFIVGALLSPWFPLYMLGVCLAWWVFSGIWLQPLPARPLTGEGLHWYRRALGATLVLCSALYLLVLLCGLQARHEADARFYTLLQRGEVAVLRGAPKDGF
jgi:hypothetical protein